MLVTRFRHHKRSGMTLIEIMIVVVLIAALMGIAAAGFGVLGQADVRGEALRVSSAIRYTFNLAATSNTTLQMKLNFEDGTFQVEKLDVFGGLSVDTLNGKTMKSVTSGSLTGAKRSQRMDDEDVRFGNVTREPVEDDMFLSGDDAKLDEDVFFVGLMTSHHDEVQTDDVGTINFFSNGFVERSVIYLGDQAARDGLEEGVYYTIIVNPLTGQSTVQPGKTEISSSFFEEEEDR